MPVAAGRRALLLGAALAPLGELLAQGARRGFDSQGLAATLRELGLSPPQPSRDLQLEAPDIAENGALVRVELACRAPGLSRLWLLAEKNPHSLLAAIEFSDALEPRLATLVKLSESGLVYGLAQLADGRLLLAQKEVRVTLGGCTA